MLRPRESRELKLIKMNINTTPAGRIDWSSDVFGNAIAIAGFDAGEAGTDTLLIESTAELDLTSDAWPVFPIAASAASYPFRYSSEERADLGMLLQAQYLDPMQCLGGWAHGFVHGNPTDTLSLLKDLNAGVSAAIQYQARDDEGTQSPSRTLSSGRGSCRDMALLFVEACRVLGFGVRIVSGYLCSPANPVGATHAWAEVFVPGAGWITFDPTHGRMGGFNLIPVAVARDLAQAMPVSGSFIGGGNDLARLTVGVEIEPLRETALAR